MTGAWVCVLRLQRATINNHIDIDIDIDIDMLSYA